MASTEQPIVGSESFLNSLSDSHLENNIKMNSHNGVSGRDSNSSDVAAAGLDSAESSVGVDDIKVSSSGDLAAVVPPIPADIRPLQPHCPMLEHTQYGDLFIGPGAKKLRLRPSREEEEIIKRAKKFAMEQSVKHVLMKQTKQYQEQQMTMIKRQQALLLMCRVYVGSINFELREETVRQAFCAFGPIKTVNLSWDPITNKHKGFAFIEYELPEAAQLALDQMNGNVVGGRNIKVGRPSNMPQTIIDQLMEEAKTYNRIFVASVHPEISETDLQSVFEAFGKIRSCKLAKDVHHPGKHRGYGFLEYEAPQSATDAIASMNMFDLGGQHLRVGRAITPQEGLNPALATASAPSAMPTAAAVAAAAVTARIQEMEAKAAGGVLTSAQTASLMTGVNSGTGAMDAPQNYSSMPHFSPPSSPFQPSSPSRPSSAGSSPQTNNFYTPPPPPPPHRAPEPVGPPEEDATVPQLLPSNYELTAGQKQLLGLTHTDESSVTLQQQEDLTVKGRDARQLVMRKLLRTESRVIVLRNMVTAEDVDESLDPEIREECGKFGPIDRVVIYQEQQGEDESEIIVKIFVEFAESQGVERAKEALNGRFFAGRKVKAESYDQVAFDTGDYSG